MYEVDPDAIKPENYDDEAITFTKSMSPAEFKVLRESVGIFSSWMMERWNVNARRMKVWGRGDFEVPIPDDVVNDLRRWARLAQERVDALISLLDQGKIEALFIGSGAENSPHNPKYDPLEPVEEELPYSWYRNVVGRVVAQRPGTKIYLIQEYEDAKKPGTKST